MELHNCFMMRSSTTWMVQNIYKNSMCIQGMEKLNRNWHDETMNELIGRVKKGGNLDPFALNAAMQLIIHILTFEINWILICQFLIIYSMIKGHGPLVLIFLLHYLKVIFYQILASLLRNQLNNNNNLYKY